MSLSLQVYAIRDMSARLEPMLNVLNACSLAGVSFPPEMIGYFGDAWKQFGADADKLRDALENVRLPIDGDLLSADGASINLDSLPPGTFALRIKAQADAQSLLGTTPFVARPLPAAAPIPFPVMPASRIPFPEPMPFDDEPAPLAFSPPVSFSSEVEIEERLVDDDDELLDLDEPTDIIPQSEARPLVDDVVIEFPAQSGPVSRIADSPLNVDMDDYFEEPEPAPMLERTRYEEKRVINLDQEDDLVLSVEDDLLDIDDLDDPLELDEPAEQR